MSEHSNLNFRYLWFNCERLNWNFNGAYEGLFIDMIRADGPWTRGFLLKKPSSRPLEISPSKYDGVLESLEKHFQNCLVLSMRHAKSRHND